MITSKLSRRSRITIPSSIRTALNIQPGDRIAYAIEGDRVVVCRVSAAGSDSPAVFDEWCSEADQRAYAKL
ncbi:MAG: type II toxin-antitoxin system PrlF family antitoxin [Proteobacteria bacterium]|nr:type II toxin-antitoxin system PrlF family antitoxin [Pseudomonadota bacterium]MBI3499367.1 type II toxin-antitoxin system PrlF family antitoxin [Pseudomonadota bacterium]